jgi:hypothetical protein
MEWLTLLLLVPAIVIPVIVLFGFAGCGAEIGPGVLTAPTITLAKPVDEHTIRVEWTNPNFSATRVEILRTPEGPGPPPTADQQSPFLDKQLTPGVTYSYRIRAVRDSDGETSDYSDVAFATTWVNTFTANFEEAGENVDASGDCLVQRFDPPSLSRGGNLVRIEAKAASNAKLVVSKISVSYASASTVADLYDSDNTPVEIIGPFSAEPSLTFVVEAPFRVETFRPLLVAFDVSAPGNTRKRSASNVSAFTKAGTPEAPVAEASLPDRSGFSAHANEVWMITRLAVGTETRGSV